MLDGLARTKIYLWTNFFRIFGSSVPPIGNWALDLSCDKKGAGDEGGRDDSATAMGVMLTLDSNTHLATWPVLILCLYTYPLEKGSDPRNEASYEMAQGMRDCDAVCPSVTYGCRSDSVSTLISRS